MSTLTYLINFIIIIYLRFTKRLIIITSAKCDICYLSKKYFRKWIISRTNLLNIAYNNVGALMIKITHIKNLLQTGIMISYFNMTDVSVLYFRYVFELCYYFHGAKEYKTMNNTRYKNLINYHIKSGNENFD
jgi:hypothetical protein